MSFKRSNGILLHISSLPGNYGIGSLGAGAVKFIDFLAEAEVKLWQICPLGPTGYGDSPYQTFSAFAGNPYLIDFDKLIEQGYLSEEDLVEVDFENSTNIDYGKVINFKIDILKKAFIKFKEKIPKSFEGFCRKQNFWLEDYAQYMAIKMHFGGKSWLDWDKDIKERDSEKLEYYANLLKDDIVYYKFLQYIFFSQWNEIKSYANKKNIKIVGDIPIFIAMDSADTWSNTEMFYFDKEKNPLKIAGVPPDFFSKTGQLWGNPLYDWDYIEKNDYRWWIQRFAACEELYDMIRVDHFRGFAAYWAIPFGEKTAVNGVWEDGPGEKIFNKVKKELGRLPIIAEDLGVITEDVEELRDEFEFPGMKILQFAFDDKDTNEYLPENFITNCVVYTGTHDNETTEGWYQNLELKERKLVNNYLKKGLKAFKDQELDQLDPSDMDEGVLFVEEISWKMIELIWKSKADLAIAPMQDFLGLDNNSRMNTPGNPSGNWQWRVAENQLTLELAEKIKKLNQEHER